MNFYLAVTDNDWFKFLSQRTPDEVNFWQPGGNTTFKAIAPGEPFLFKLHSPYNYIVGGGFFVRHFFLPLTLAWDAFEEKNGEPNLQSLRTKIQKYRSKEGRVEPNPQIGCIILANPFFFPESDWIDVTDFWPKNLTQGKTFHTDEEIGSRIWDQVSDRLKRQTLTPNELHPEPATISARERYGDPYLTRPRLGQGAFRVLVTEAYDRRCAITGEKTLPVLTAAHIKPYSQAGPHEVRNGLLLREDLHTLFDRGYLTVTDDLHVEVSRRIKEDFGNGREYYAMHGKQLLILPGQAGDRPAQEYLRWHNEHVYAS
ncbi:MAG TPA: HNH endonuclease [Bacillota bacterium]|nr:HNH endonuclease [Bacillota bacterium]